MICSLVKCTRILIFASLFCSAESFLRRKVKRIQAGKLYNRHDDVHVVVNKVGRSEELSEAAIEDKEVELHHRGERRMGAVSHRQRFGESIVGDRRETSPYEISFQDDVEWRLLCKQTLQPAELEKFKDAILNSYFFEMFVEDLPMWGYVGDVSGEDLLIGEVDGSHVYLFPHLHFRLGYNGNQLVSAKVSTDLERRVDITDTSQSKQIKFSYSVEWHGDEIEWKDRMTRYSDSRFVPSSFEIHWLSIINSFVLVLLLTAFLMIIMLRVLKNDFSRYMDLDDEALEEEESGWKLIHGDVFRFPVHRETFCAAIGTGNQLLVMTLFHLSLALMNIISTTRRGSVLAGVVVLYSLTSFVGGYSAIRLYRKMNGKNWVRCTLTTAALFPAPVAGIFFWVNTMAIAHGSTSALPFTALLTVSALYVFVSVPLTIGGGLMAKRYASADFDAPTRTTKVAREIPTEIPWYRGRIFQVLIAGFLPFSAIYIELHYIFASMWGHQIYSLFGILFLAFVLLVIVTSFITVALLYFQLTREDHRWWWASYVNGGMTGAFIFAYSFYYYFQRSEMSGVLQGSIFFGYMTVISYAFFIMLGAAGFQFSLLFVKYIYSRIKSD